MNKTATIPVPKQNRDQMPFQNWRCRGMRSRKAFFASTLPCWTRQRRIRPQPRARSPKGYSNYFQLQLRYTQSKMKPGADAFPNRSGHL